jgi:hypothetical protein
VGSAEEADARAGRMTTTTTRNPLGAPTRSKIQKMIQTMRTRTGPPNAALTSVATPRPSVSSSARVPLAAGSRPTGLGTKGFGYHLVDGIDRDVPARMDKIKAAQRLGGLRVDKYASSEDDWSTGVVRTGGYALVGLFVCCVIVPRWRRARFVRRNASKGHVRRSPK